MEIFMNFNCTKLNKLKNKKILLDILNINGENSKILDGEQVSFFSFVKNKYFQEKEKKY